MLPSLLLCIALTVLIVVGTWTFVERRHIQWTTWCLTAVVWLAQATRWARRVFGTTYRLTNRRLLIEHGHWRSRRLAVDLNEVERIFAESGLLGRILKVGRIVVQRTSGPELVLDGVRYPEMIVKRLGALCPRAGAG